MEPAAPTPPAAERVTTERITVALIPKAAEDLERLQDRTSLSKTDIVNRAISAYEFFDRLWRSGDDLILLRGGEKHLVRFL